jgi:quercetin dioxygenase-like cupin family protein
MTNSGMELVHTDERRTIREMVHELPGGPLTRVTRIDVTADNAVLGNHYHPHAELFMVQVGGGLLMLAPAENLRDITEREFRAGDVILVPARTAHTFVCSAGTVLTALTDWKLYEGAIIPAPLG